MIRRLLASVSGSVLGMIALAILVVGGLTWVTITSLKVERCQRETAASAEALNRERLALWRLDSFMLAPLSLENSRPYNHYFPLYSPTTLAPDNPVLAQNDLLLHVPSPLLSAELSPWMALHVRIDADRGWDSPQVLTPEILARIQADPSELSTDNCTTSREQTLNRLRKQFPVMPLLQKLIDQDQVDPDIFLYSVPVPHADEPSQSKPGPDYPHYRHRENPQFQAQPRQVTPQPMLDDIGACRTKPMACQQTDVQNTTTNRGLLSQPSITAMANNLLPWYGNISHPQFQMTMSADSYLTKLHANIYSVELLYKTEMPASQNRNTIQYQSITLTNSSILTTTLNNITTSNSGNTVNIGGLNGIVGSVGPTEQNVNATQPGRAQSVNPQGLRITNAMNPSYNSGNSVNLNEQSKAGPRSVTDEEKQRDVDLRKDVVNRTRGGSSYDLGSKSQNAVQTQIGNTTRGMPASAGVRGVTNSTNDPLSNPVNCAATNAMPIEYCWNVNPGMPWECPTVAPRSQPYPTIHNPASVKPYELASNGSWNSDRLSEQLISARKAGLFPIMTRDSLAESKPGPSVAPLAVHLAPMRPRWIVSPDNERYLCLLRLAQVESRIVYQGVVLDWDILKKSLLERISDLYPDATLIPVDTGEPSSKLDLSALPVRLEPGDCTLIPLNAWSPLRTSLVIAWVAALLSILAVALGSRAIFAMSERRVRFASAVTHELRSPLTTMQLHLDLLNSGLITDETTKAEYLNTLATEADRLNRLVENVLDFARLEKKSAQANAQVVPLVDFLSKIRNTWHDRLKNEGFSLVLDTRIDETTNVMIDPRVLSQVLGNLLDNARKYAKSHIEIDPRIRVTTMVNDQGRVIVDVEDHGPGVPVAEQKAIFRPFKRGTSATETGGTGLGLSLARQWIELFEGSLTYRPFSTGNGACFRIELPRLIKPQSA